MSEKNEYICPACGVWKGFGHAPNCPGTSGPTNKDRSIIEKLREAADAARARCSETPVQIPRKGDPAVGDERKRLTRIFLNCAAFNIYPDGDQWCATFQDFENTQESPIGFGNDEYEAVIALLESFT